MPSGLLRKDCWLGLKEAYLPLSEGVRPNMRQIPTDIESDAMIMMTAAKAIPHLDFTISILPRKANTTHP